MVFVTGGTGLVGGYLLKSLLEKQQEITALYRSRFPSQLNADESKRIRWVKGDVLDIDLLEEITQGCKQIYHCAGMVSFNLSRKQEMWKINMEGTANVVNAAMLNGVERFIHVSSVSAIGRTGPGQLINENTKWDEETNLSFYGKTKYYGEMEVWRGFSEGLKGAIVNPSIVLGVGDWNQGSSALFKNAYHSFPWYAEGSTGFVDAADVAECMILLMNSDITEERFILSAENWNFREAFTVMAEAFQKKPPYLHAGPFLSQLAWRLEKIKSGIMGKEPLLTRETVRSGRSRVNFDNSKILQYLPGFQFLPVRQTIGKYAAEYLANLNG